MEQQQPGAAAAPPPPWQQQQQQATTFRADVRLEDLRQRLQDFAAERSWQQYHTPRNLLLALVGEVGELSECFQWRGEVAPGLPGFTQAERRHVGQELSDVLLYLLRLADACGIDLAQAALDKLQHNAQKYPADACRGRADKYTAYTQQHPEQQQQPEKQPEQQQLQRPGGGQ